MHRDWTIMEAAMPMPCPTADCFARRLCLAAALLLLAAPAWSQQPPPPPPAMPPARIIVNGVGSVTAAPDYAEITTGVTTRAKTAREATDANNKLMTHVEAALDKAGIAKADIQTARFSVQPVYAEPQPNTAPKLVGYSVSNQLRIRVRRIADVGAILDTLVSAGATDAGNVQFLHSDVSKVLDQARQAAVADARRKAELYAQSAGLTLGGVAWISEEPAYAPSTPGIPLRMAASPASVPISPGQDTLRVTITVGFEVAHK